MVATDLTMYPLIRWVEDTTMAVSVMWLATAGSMEVNLSMEIETIAESALSCEAITTFTYMVHISGQ